MAGTTKSDEIFFDIRSHKAARLHMMNLEIFVTSAPLAAPLIALEHLLPEAPVSVVFQAKPGMS